MTWSSQFHRRIGAVVCAAAAALLAGNVAAQEPVKIGLVMPLTGVLAPVGKQAVAGARLYVAQHGDVVAGRKVTLIVRDDASIPDVSKRVAQELMVNEKIDIIGGGITPSVLAIAPLATESKKATVVMVSGTSIVTERSPYFVRTSWTHAQQASVLADWAAKNGSQKVTIIASDWAPGAEASGVFTTSFTKAGGTILESIKVPLSNPDFAPFLQRARDSGPIRCSSSFLRARPRSSPSSSLSEDSTSPASSLLGPAILPTMKICLG
jgi:branched-chain amino acid transport system substrate-binding protein